MYLGGGGLLVGFCEGSSEDSCAGEDDLGYYSMGLVVVSAGGGRDCCMAVRLDLPWCI